MTKTVKKSANQFGRTQTLVITSLLAALIMIMTFTGIGYIPIGPLKLTFLVLPVAIGSIILGPKIGLLLGTIFGLSSFITCFGLDAFGAVLLSINPFYTFVTCVVPRMLCGFLPGLIYKGLANNKFLARNNKQDIVATSIASVSVSVINTLFFLGFMWFLFAQDFLNNKEVIEVLGGTVIDSFKTLIVDFAGVNALAESAATLILGVAIVTAKTSTNRFGRTQTLVITSLLAALIMIMTFTGIGYIPIGPLKLTFLVLPVAIGSIILGPKIGLLLGTIFGLSSFITCFGLDAFGAVLLSINPFYTFVTCVVPRMLCGFLPGLIYKGLANNKFLAKHDKQDITATSIASVSTALINTLFFLGFMWLLFAEDFLNNEEVIGVLGGTVIGSFKTLIVAFAGINAIIESATALILGTAIIKALKYCLKRLS